MLNSLIKSGIVLAVAGGCASAALGGRTAGPGQATNCLTGRSTTVYLDTFDADEIAVVRVEGDGDSDLDLRVYDEFGRLIASDLDESDECLVTFTPRWTGTFRLEVRNFGRRTNCYVLHTN